MAQIDVGKAWGYAKDVLALAVIPLFLWGVKLEVGNALRDERISQLQAQIAEAQDIEKSVQGNSLSLVRLEGKIDAANGRLDEIKSLLD